MNHKNLLAKWSPLALILACFLVSGSCSSRPEVVEKQDNPTTGFLLFELSPAMASMVSARAQMNINQVIYWNRVDFTNTDGVVSFASDAQIAGFRVYETTMISASGTSLAMIAFEDVIVQDYPFPYWVSPRVLTVTISPDARNPLTAAIDEAVRTAGMESGAARITGIDPEKMTITVELVDQI